ncbi:Carnitine O-acetyltransferase mitochondrial [Allomyces arbusculus]|nr:Carnitine O-acetyltransferase mitochondrial [Allomyces arbusculus]
MTDINLDPPTDHADAAPDTHPLKAAAQAEVDADAPVEANGANGAHHDDEEPAAELAANGHADAEPVLESNDAPNGTDREVEPETETAPEPEPEVVAETVPRGPLYAQQSSLPHLPVPDLDATLKKYLQTVRPHVDDDGYARTEAVVAEFLANQGPELQERLLARAQECNARGTSWLAEWWNDVAYLGYRDPVVLNVNYFIHMVDDRRVRNKPLARAAALVHATAEFRAKVLDESLEPEMMRGGIPLCSKQYHYMFHSCRVPAAPRDTYKSYYPESHPTVVVIRKNQFFVMDLLHRDGELLTPEEIYVQLDRIVELAGTHTELAIGALTTAHRDTWAAVHGQLAAIPGNQEALEAIEASAFVLCLDDSAPVTRSQVARAAWHGDGRNRWFDKPVQLLVWANGKAALNGEHAMMDATPTGRLAEWIAKRAAGLPPVQVGHDARPVLESALPPPTKIEFMVTSRLAQAVREAEVRFDTDVAHHDLFVMAWDGYGKELIKTFKVSPDGFVQMALQLAYYKMYGHTAPMYETAQTRKFLHGRTETGRTVSVASVELVKAMEDTDLPATEKVALARAAIASQVKYMKEACNGLGVDRHLMGLRMLVRSDEPTPPLFTDPAFAATCHWTLSTSQLSSPWYDGYGWGQVVPDGYGLAYMVLDDSIHVNITSRRGVGGDQLRHYLTEALLDLKRAFVEAKKAEAAEAAADK